MCMLHIYTGTDSYSKDLEIKEIKRKTGASFTVVPGATLLKAQTGVGGGDLFASKKAFLIYDISPETLPEKNIATLISSKDEFYIIVGKLDARKSTTKALKANKEIKFKDFPIPTGNEVRTWLENYLKTKSLQMDSAAQTELLNRLGVDLTGKSFSDPNYDLWQFVNEISKLESYIEGKKITKEDVQKLTTQDKAVEVFALVNALAEKNRPKTLEFIENFFSDGSSTDDKAKVIQLGALISEQLRSLLLIRSAMDEHIPDASVLSETGWKPGRLSITKRLASNFETIKLTSTLEKLQSLDMEMKSSQVPPRVLLDLIIAQLI